ncbi:MAG: ABC transporter substrate-binding protein [Chloroflexi bacterium]|nr:ABC transporter substrate-binding protein [Chloroflexota bacterium]
MDATRDDDKELLQRTVSRKITRRTLLKGLAGLTTLGVLGSACQTAQPTAPQPSPTTGEKPSIAPTKAATPAAAASPVAKQIALLKPRPMKINWTAVSGAMSGVWMAHETGAWKEMGIESELIHIASSSRVVAAFEAREIDGSILDWVVAFTSVAAGANGRIVAAALNRQIFSVMGAKGITKPEELKGKRFGITRIGSSTHTASLLALELWGMKPTDVNFIALQEVPAILAALQAGQVDAGTVSPPTNTRAVKAGFTELVNLGAEGPEYPSVGLGTTQELINSSPDAVLALVAGYSLGVKRFRSDPERAVQVLKKYLQIDDQEVLLDTQKQFSKYLAWPPTMPFKSAQRVLEDVVKTEPKAANVKVEQVATNRFIDELDKVGFFK